MGSYRVSVQHEYTPPTESSKSVRPFGCDVGRILSSAVWQMMGRVQNQRTGIRRNGAEKTVLGSRGIGGGPIDAGDTAAHRTDIAAELAPVVYRMLESQGDEIYSR
jgi:hypothetical protein